MSGNHPGNEVSETFSWNVTSNELFSREGDYWTTPVFSTSNDNFKWVLSKHLILTYDDQATISFYLRNISAKNTSGNGEVTISIWDNSWGKFASQSRTIVSDLIKEAQVFHFDKLNLRERDFRSGTFSTTLKIMCEFKGAEENKPKSFDGNCDCLIDEKRTRRVDSIYEPFLHDESISDIELILGDKRYPAHKLVLAANSPVFHRMFSHQMKETLSKEVEIEEMDQEVFEELLKFMYTKKVAKFKELAGDLLIAANRYEMEDLKSICEREMIKCVDLENVLDFVRVADSHCAEKLKKHCFCIIMANFSKVVEKEEFKKLIKTHANVLLELNQEMASKCKVEIK